MGTINRHLANVTAFAVAIDQMLHYPATVNDLIYETGLHRNTVRKLVRALHIRNCVVKTMELDRFGRHNTPAYRIKGVK